MGAEGTKTGLIGGWVKAAVTSVFGLVSGAVLMYVTPLFNNAIKPPRPVANFAHQAQGLTVHFQNRSSGGTQGWWDFGDGTALEPFSPQQEALSHTYAKAGNYNVRLSLQNLFNEESERAATVNVDAGSAPPPVIEQFQVVPISPGMTVPCAFRLLARVKNAQTLVWSYGEGKPMEISFDTGEVQERWFTAEEAGYYTFRLAAVGGRQVVEKASEPQFVSMPDNSPYATVRVVYEAVQVERKEEVWPVLLSWKPGQAGSTSPAVGERGRAGYQVVKAEFTPQGQDELLRGTPALEVAADKSKVVVKGELVRPAGAARSTPSTTALVRVTLEKRSRPAAKPMEVPMYVKVPGSTAIPLPRLSDGWQPTKAQVSLELKEGSKVMWSGSQMPTNAPLQLKGRPVLVTATMQESQVVLQVDNHPAALRPVGN